MKVTSTTRTGIVYQRGARGDGIALGYTIFCRKSPTGKGKTTQALVYKR